MSFSSGWKQFVLMLWKTGLQVKRSKALLASTIAVPLFIFAIILSVRLSNP